MGAIPITLSEENIEYLRQGGQVTVHLDESIIDAEPRVVISHEQLEEEVRP